jgi:hypothetical protein
MHRFFKPTSPSTKAHLDERAAERSKETQQRFDERDAAIREAREEERKAAEVEAPPKIRRKPGPKPKLPKQPAAPASPDDPNPYGSAQGRKRKRGKGPRKNANYWDPPVMEEILRTIQKTQSLHRTEQLLKAT